MVIGGVGLAGVTGVEAIAATSGAGDGAGCRVASASVPGERPLSRDGVAAGGVFAGGVFAIVPIPLAREATAGLAGGALGRVTPLVARTFRAGGRGDCCTLRGDRAVTLALGALTADGPRADSSAIWTGA